MPNDINKIAKLMRYWILTSSTAAGSGHPTSSLSAVELMAVLFFNGYFKYDIKNPENQNNDRLIFSKGHASPLFYSLWAAVAGSSITNKELTTFRKFTSRLEGHPTRRLPYTEVATGSLGQGLSVGVGMALNARYDGLAYKTFVLLGDSEMAEGSNWEAMQVAAYYKLNNLIGIIDVNRLGQRGETMPGHDVKDFADKAKAFGWEAVVVDGHNVQQVARVYDKALKGRDAIYRVSTTGKPVMIIAKTLKGKGVSFLENKDGWHGKALAEDDLNKAIKELGEVDHEARGQLKAPSSNPAVAGQTPNKSKIINPKSKIYRKDEQVATRQAYGDVIAALAKANKQVVVLDAEVSNSTFAETVKEKTPRQFFEMFITEQNMVGAALGLARRGKIPFVSTFAAFFTRAADQIRMCQYSGANIKFIGSHAGVSIGEDGASQMGLEEIALFRSVHNSVVLYPSDAVATQKLVLAAAKHDGLVYLQTTRAKTPVIYSNGESFKIGGSKTIFQSKKDVATVIAAGIALHEAIKAFYELQKQGIHIRVIDLYSVKPLDTKALQKACQETQALIVVEDNHPEGGLYEAVCGSGVITRPTYSLAVTKLPRSGKPEELLKYEGIDAAGIVEKVKSIITT
ncbi:MAG: transketolase [bacterium]|nr:transketolase [bacterium]